MTELQLLQYAYIGIRKTIEDEKIRAQSSYRPEIARERLAIAEKHFSELTELMEKVSRKG